jgi:hypothetical protein
MITIIDGNVADIKFENEKKLGDVPAGIERRVDGSGFCLSRINIDGVEIETTPFAVFYAEALDKPKMTLYSWRQAVAGRNLVGELWRKSPAAAFPADHDKTPSCALRAGFSDETVKNVTDMVNERAAEERQPLRTFLDMEDELNETAGCLPDLPLDLQTENGRRAAETIQGFSNFMRKILRLFPLLKYAMPEKPDAAHSLLFEGFRSALKKKLPLSAGT